MSGHEVSTVQSCGWRGILNGELLRIADESFNVSTLADKNLRYQQNMDGRRIAIIELPTNRWPLLLPLAPRVAGTVRNAQAGECIIVDLTS